jgi:16S rRNA (cytidine1402-2'-O)-methyltransferase
VRRDTLGGLVAWAEAGEVRGEIVVVVEGAPERAASANAEDLVARVLARADAGLRLKDAVAAVADETGAAKRDLYQAALAARGR